MDKSRFQLDFEFKAITQTDGSLVLRGYAATHALDRDKEMFTPDALKAALTGYLANPVVLLGHDTQKVIGKITSAVVDHLGVFVEALIPAPVEGTESWAVKAYHDIKNGLYRAFSVGGLFAKAKGGGGQIVGMDWMETSVVAVPSNPTALFEVVQKSFDLEEKAAMTAAERNKLDASDFGYVDSDGKGHFPLNDEDHVRAAVSMFSRASFPDAATRKRCASRILSRAKKYGIDVADDSAVAQAAHGKSLEIDALRLVLADLDAGFERILSR